MCFHQICAIVSFYTTLADCLGRGCAFPGRMSLWSHFSLWCDYAVHRLRLRIRLRLSFPITSRPLCPCTAGLMRRAWDSQLPEKSPKGPNLHCCFNEKLPRHEPAGAHPTRARERVPSLQEALHGYCLEPQIVLAAWPMLQLLDVTCEAGIQSSVQALSHTLSAMPPNPGLFESVKTGTALKGPSSGTLRIPNVALRTSELSHS